MVHVIRSFFNNQDVVEGHKFLKEGYASSEKKVQAIFFRLIEYEKPQKKTCQGSEALLTITVEGIISFLQELKSSLKPQIFEKTAIIPVKKNFGLFLVVLRSITNLK